MALTGQAARATPLWRLSIAEASDGFAAGAFSPVDLVESYLERIAAIDRQIHAFIHVAAGSARAEAAVAAREIAAGRKRGPLHGIPYAVKDNFDAAGLPATAGSRLRLGRVPDCDAALVARLREAGAILLGKLSTWEYGTGNGGEYFDLPFPPARNPWDIGRFTGGSSTGAGAAVAAGLAMFTLGSDTTGSVRLPAAATGVVGVIGSPGQLARDGILPNCFTLDRPGVFGWTVADASCVFEMLATPPPPPAGAGRLRIAVVRDLGPGFPLPDAPMAAAFDAALAILVGLGAALVPLKLPVPAEECFRISRLIGPPESSAIHAEDFRDRGDEMGAALRDKLASGALVSAVDYIRALKRCDDMQTSMTELLRSFDALVTFGTLHTPPRLGVEPEMTAYTIETALTPFNLSGHPVLVQCTGYTHDGLPLHWQIVANRGDEAAMFRVARAYEDATPWRSRRPPLAEGVRSSVPSVRLSGSAS